jgi:hypothetical protein
MSDWTSITLDPIIDAIHRIGDRLDEMPDAIDLLAVHAPADPQSWFKPVMEPLEPAPPLPDDPQWNFKPSEERVAREWHSSQMHNPTRYEYPVYYSLPGPRDYSIRRRIRFQSDWIEWWKKQRDWIERERKAKQQQWPYAWACAVHAHRFTAIQSTPRATYEAAS